MNEFKIIKFPITRIVLVEKRIKTVNQMKQFLKQEFSECSFYRYCKDEQIIFYTKNNFTLLEIKIDGVCAFLNADYTKNYEIIKHDLIMRQEIRDFIFKDLFRFENYSECFIDFYGCSGYAFVVSNSLEIS